MYCIAESTCDIGGTFLRPRNHSAPPAVIRRPGIVPLLPPLRYTPTNTAQANVQIASFVFVLEWPFYYVKSLS